jgi:hypothetical protein
MPRGNPLPYDDCNAKGCKRPRQVAYVGHGEGKRRKVRRRFCSLHAGRRAFGEHFEEKDR